jgi:uncharacterized iron-regulated membrane protein
VKVSPRTYAVQWDLHGWLGVVVAIPLFVVFFCGTFALYHHELALWQDPALHAVGAPTRPTVFDELTAQLVAADELPPGVDVGFEVAHDARHVRASVGEPEQVHFVDPLTGAREPQRSRLSEALYGLHFLEPLPGGLQLSGVLSIALLVVAVSGLLLQLGGFLRRSWRFRPRLRRRWWAADAHTSLGVLALPFVVVMAWSGATLSLGPLFGAGLAHTSLDGDLAAVQEIRGYGGTPEGRSGRDVDARPLGELVTIAQGSVGTDEMPHYAGLVLRGDANAWAFVFFESTLGQPWRYVFVRARDGKVLLDTSHARTPARALEEPLFALHFAWFGGAVAKACYAVLTLAVCVLIVAGQLVWLDRRRRTAPSRADALVARVTVGVCAGLVLAVAVYFAANRLLPAAIDDRAGLEWAAFLFAWSVAFVAAFVPRKLGAIAAAYLGASAIIELGVVALDLARLSRASLAIPAVAQVEGLLIGLAIAGTGVAWLARRAGDGPLLAGTDRRLAEVVGRGLGAAAARPVASGDRSIQGR